MFITISEVIAILAMIFAMGYIFSDTFRKPVDEEDPVKFYLKKTGKWANIKLAAMIAAPAVVFHELAHKFVAMGFGAEATLHAPYGMYAIVMILKAIGFPFLFFVGGYVSHTPLPALESAFVAIAGPLTNFILWGVCSLIVKYKLVNRKYYHIIIPMGKINMFLGIFNLIPIPGFDGYHFFSSLLQVFS